MHVDTWETTKFWLITNCNIYLPVTGAPSRLVCRLQNAKGSISGCCQRWRACMGCKKENLFQQFGWFFSAFKIIRWKWEPDVAAWNERVMHYTSDYRCGRLTLRVCLREFNRLVARLPAHTVWRHSKDSDPPDVASHNHATSLTDIGLPALPLVKRNQSDNYWRHLYRQLTSNTIRLPAHIRQQTMSDPLYCGD